MTASADTLYLPILAPAKVAVPDFSLRQPPGAPHRRQPRLYRIPSPHVIEGMTYGMDGKVAVERTIGSQIDIFA
ncbi:hypothetical protein [Desulfatitalea tepidiphila]|uniref:hypothetical protein n=1 Tax=Desulfatitalea tepidiphila TaxID=1185843 RepID=UPI0006B61A39|nr:hypothetical protein [Desulfatitalea tepidiphila]